MNPNLDSWRVPLDDDAAKRWREEYGVTGIYLNDVAAGALIEVPATWGSEDGVKRVASGLRHLLQDLWHLDLVRPVLAVCHLAADLDEATQNRLRLLPWDDEWHRGDFALRTTGSAADAERLLFTLMGDTMGALDENALADRVGLPEVRETLDQRLADLRKSESEATYSARFPARLPERILVEALIEALDRAAPTAEEPDLVSVLDAWVESEAGRP